jgi:catechol 2,3-dioxygenase-like lactoylglutathione lyase family enzyme
MAIAHFTLAARDVRRSARFFEVAMGWRPIERADNIGVPSARLEIAPGHEFDLVESSVFEPSPFERDYGRPMAISHPVAYFPRPDAAPGGRRCRANLYHA